MSEQQVPIPSGHDVYWEKWIDAYNNEDTKKLKTMVEDPIYDDGGMMLEDAFSQPIKTILTPFGALPLTEQSLASNHFKFWVGHCNFKLFERYYAIIAACDGVEAIDILTPYRFRIAIGKLFQDRQVMDTVRKTLLGATNHESKK